MRWGWRDLVAEAVADIEDVHRPLAIGGHHRGGDGKSRFEDGLGHVIEQARAGPGIPLRSRVAMRDASLSKWTLGRMVKALALVLRTALGGERAARRRSRRQGLLDGLARGAPAVRDRSKASPFRVLHRKHVEREAIGGGEGLGVDDGAARHGDGAGELREQAGIVGGVENDLGDGAEGVGGGVAAPAAAPWRDRPWRSAGRDAPCSSVSKASQ